MMESYINGIKHLADPSFQKIRRMAMDSISHLSDEERDELYVQLNRGTALLDSHELLCEYLWAYGNMHEDKIKTALQHMPLEIFSQQNIQVVDWGCGQGLATVCLFDYLRSNNIQANVSKILLIEPAELTLQRAVLHVESYTDDNTQIVALQKFLNDIEDKDIQSEADVTIHFFSNILDVESVKVDVVARLIANNISGEHYFVCVGPLNSNNQRIDAFANWFQTPQIIWEHNHNKDKHNYTAKHKLFKIEHFNNSPILVPFNPPVQFHAAYELDSVRSALQTYEESDSLMKALSAFEVSTPFDLGASIYDDVDPVLAVLNNIIVRGLPTKASPMIEKAFCQLGNKEVDSEFVIDYEGKDIKHEEVFLALHLADNRFSLDNNQYNKKLLDSDLERHYINDVAPKQFQQILLPQRALLSITKKAQHFAQRVDFSIEFPYKELDESGREYKGCVIELDGAKYHEEDSIEDERRVQDLKEAGWKCIRIAESELTEGNFNYLGSKYVHNVFKAYAHKFDSDWAKTLQFTLSPIAIARLEKTIIEALLIGKLDIDIPEWNVLVNERDVPCAALAFADIEEMFSNLTALSQKFDSRSFPKIMLTVISNAEFCNSPLHKLNEHDGLTVNVLAETTEAIKSKTYDMVVDISMLRRSGLEDISFSDFKCKNDCYFNIRSSHYKRNERHIYTTDVIDYKPLVNKDSHGEYHPVETAEKQLCYFMQLLFRKKKFRSGQLPILSRALQNKCVIGLLPTGGGKSLTYQIAAMLQPGVTIVVDPLRSLMKDQYDGLLKAGIDTCTHINSAIQFPQELENASDSKKREWLVSFKKRSRSDQTRWASEEKERRAKLMEASQMQLVFLSPERLCIFGFREKLKNMHDLGVYFSYGVVDEVHCVSEWGHDFRFTYLHLGRNLYNYVLPKQTSERRHLTLFGLTATASFDVLADVERELSGHGQFPLDSDTIVRDENTYRLELQYRIEKVPIEYELDKYYDKNNKLDADLPRAVNITGKRATYSSKRAFLEKYLSEMPSLIEELQAESSLDVIRRNFFKRQNRQLEDTVDLRTSMPEDYASEREEYMQAGIVFCPHKNNTGISVNANAETISSKMAVGTFMGSGDESEEESDRIDEISFRNLELFRDNKLPLMIATKAFGMGIDKPNVRFTINMNYSSSLESFVQEAGRAGRDRKTALSVILLSDYQLERISPKCPDRRFPMMIIKNKWFKKGDLEVILNRYGLNVPDEYIDLFSPEKDMVKLRCEICHKRFAFGKCGESCDKCNKGPCEEKCSLYNMCTLRKVPQDAKGFQYVSDLQNLLLQHGLSVPAKHFEYQNVDYETVMFFYNNNFKGSLIEKRTMYELLNKSSMPVFVGNDAEKKDTYEVSDFLREILRAAVGTELVASVSTKTIATYYGRYVCVNRMNNQEAQISDIQTGETKVVKTNELDIHRDKADVAKAIYRMCCIGLIDDFTEDYIHSAYRVVAVRKEDGAYYKALQTYLERYYSKEKAAEEIAKVPEYMGENEVHKCLGYLTEFIYDKIAVKRKRAIDDIRTFCMLGSDEREDWKVRNEQMKDFIFYYFNSKYARQDFEYPDLNEKDKVYSLKKETEDGKKEPDFRTVFKYMRVVDDDITMQDSSNQMDNIKHLHGAVRLIRRSLTDSNPTLDMLNAYCLLFLGVGDNASLQQELKDSYINAYREFRNRSLDDLDSFYRNMDRFREEIRKEGRNVVDNDEMEQIREWEAEAELRIHQEWLTQFKDKYKS